MVKSCLSVSVCVSVGLLTRVAKDHNRYKQTCNPAYTDLLMNSGHSPNTIIHCVHLTRACLAASYASYSRGYLIICGVVSYYSESQANRRGLTTQMKLTVL